MTVATEPLLSKADVRGGFTEIPEGISATRRRTLLRLISLERGIHPITSLPLHPQAPADASNKDRYPRFATCGTCVHRVVQQHHDYSYPKCDELSPAELALRTSRTDTYKWLPACVAYRPA